MKVNEYISNLEDAHAALVGARKAAALYDLPHYELIGSLIDKIEEIIVYESK